MSIIDSEEQKITRCACGKWIFVIDGANECVVCAKLYVPNKRRSDDAEPYEWKEQTMSRSNKGAKGKG